MKLVAIVGPTGVGKSSLALSLAQTFGGEIINADSRQVYRYLDIGTAKPTREERDIVLHHLLDLVDPDQDFSLALYQKMAHEVIGEIGRRARLPFLVGGSGLYVWSLLEGWETPSVPPDEKLRASLLNQAVREGHQSLYETLNKLDPESAQRIDPRNIRRVIRALEVCYSGVPFSQVRKKKAPYFEALIIGLTNMRQQLYRKIDTRVDRMIEMGLVGELRELRQRGYGPGLPSMSGIGYKQIGMYIDGKLSLPEAIQQIKFESHRFSRHQYAWFCLEDERIHWLEADVQAKEKAKEWLLERLN